jgi:hypothetical protein
MRLLRHLSFGNVIALIALFVALGGAAYAGTTISGNSIKNGSIGGGKLKNETIGAGKLKKGTITATQIAPGSITSSSIDLTTLGTVPSATTATTAQTATQANSATTANSSSTADNAKHAETADSATTAGTATTATDADHATSAGEAETLEGETATELTIACQGDTQFYGGMCWDKTTRPAMFWLFAVEECGNAGGRLPSIDELIAYVRRPGEQVSGQTWSGDLSGLEGGVKKEVVFTTDENGRETELGTAGALGFRCVFPQSN